MQGAFNAAQGWKWKQVCCCCWCACVLLLVCCYYWLGAATVADVLLMLVRCYYQCAVAGVLLQMYHVLAMDP